MTEQFELATNDKNDIASSLELFMLTCQRCGRCYNMETTNMIDRGQSCSSSPYCSSGRGRCYNMETTNMIDRMDLRGFRYDNLELRVPFPKATERFDEAMLEESDRYRRPSK